MRALIVDDEYTAAQYLEALVKRHCPEITEIDVFTSALEAREALTKGCYDFLFADIEMAEMDGFELIQSLDESLLPAIIVTTAYNDYAAKAFEVDAVHYLTKPVDPEQLMEAVTRAKSKQSQELNGSILKALSRLDKSAEKITLASGNDYHVVAFGDIIRVEGEGSYATFHLRDGGKITTSKRLGHYCDELQAMGFIRPHQSHLVNLNFVIRYSRADGGELFLENDHIVPVSSRRRDMVHEALGLR